MLKQRVYYTLKPYVPRRVRIALRGLWARRARASHADIWPINEAAGASPAGWEGWPDGRRFALVLSHDVEGAEGLAKCRQLAEVEMQLGFRSCFNFVPEGEYTAPPELRSWLVNHGFEVGVHDLQHDGKLYRSFPDFEKKSHRINHYLSDWGAKGFRSGFMLRNLDWIHHLDLLYDSSTFDTDPFEFQSEGAGTIFPYWIARPAGAVSDGAARGRFGYTELPYTLPQDSTLFLVLGETTPKIWLRKLDWIAAKGGMALLNVHPDYIDFDGGKKHHSYPVGHYRSFLEYVARAYSGQYWHALPRDVAAWHRARKAGMADRSRHVDAGGDRIEPTASLSGKRVAVLLYSVYPADPRPRRAAEAMVEAGMSVDLFCLAEADTEPTQEVIRGVNVQRLRLKRQRAKKWIYFWQYGRFLFSAFCYVSRRGMQRKYDLVHVHNMPDFLVFAALLPKLQGAGIVLDLHDPMPELMMSIYNLTPQNRTVRILKLLERWSIRMASRVLTPNITFRKLFVARGCPEEKIEIVMNSPREDIFALGKDSPIRSVLIKPDAFSIMHHGLIAHRHGVDLLIEAVAALRRRIPGMRLELFGAPTGFLQTVMQRAEELGVTDLVHYHGAKTQEEIAQAITRADLGVIPNRRSSFTEINFPTRIFEYLSLRCPVIAPATTGILDYFSPEQLLTFAPDNVADLAEKIFSVWERPERAARFVERGVEVYESHRWAGERRRLLEVATAAMQA